MQFLPAASTDYYNVAANAVQGAVSSVSQNAGSSFETVYSSFIEEGRTDYSGRPAGFSALEEGSGTVDSEQAALLKDALKKRDVQDASLESLEALMASGGPVTIGRVFGVLAGNSRISPSLEGAERDSFKMLMTKLGFSKDEAEELLGMTDQGKASAVWQKMSGKLSGLDGTLDLHSDELSALLRGLDISGAAKARMEKLLGEGGALTKEQMQSLLSEASRELAAKDLAARAVQTQMREAMMEALQAAKVKEKADAVSNARGARHLDQSEAMMHDSVLKKAARNADFTGRDGTDSFDDSKGGRSRAERILAKGAEGKDETKSTDSSKDILSRLMQRIDAAAAPQTAPQQGSANVPQNAQTLPQNFRQEIFSQVEKGILQNAQNGSRQLTLQLDPKELGQLTLILSVQQGEVRALIRTEQAESTTALREQMAELKSALEEQGLKVAELEVETKLRDDSFTGQWDGTQEHNLMHDSHERDRMMRLSQLRRDAAAVPGGTDAMKPAAAAVENGLHIVA